MFACISAIGKPLPADDLSLGQYVSSDRGSTLLDLQTLANDNGVPNHVASGLVPQDLDRFQSPAVLHVRTSISDKEYAHWAAYLGSDGSTYQLYDSNQGYREVNAGSLAAIWDGHALIIGPRHEHPLLRSLFRRENALLLGAFVLSLAITRVRAPRAYRVSRKYQRVALHCVAFGFVALFTGLAYQYISPLGVISNASLIPEIYSRYSRDDICTIDTDAMRTFVSSGQGLLVDARLPADFARGTIPGAVSVSVESTRHRQGLGLAAINPGQRIVVFCQSEKCTFADEVAGELLRIGYSDVCIYRAGFAGWQNTSD